MNEVTPEMIAQIATRLYNEIPGVNRVPKTEAAVPEAASEAAGWPAGLVCASRPRGRQRCAGRIPCRGAAHGWDKDLRRGHPQVGVGRPRRRRA